MVPELGHAGIAFVAALMLAGVQASDHSDSPAAGEVLERMDEAYASCRSYIDSGKVRTTHFHQGDERISELHFATAFVRPRDFRLEFSTESYGGEDRQIVWRGASGVRRWDNWDGEVEEVGSLSLALAGVTGISSGSAHTVPALLLAEVGGPRITDGNVLGLDEAEHEGVACYRVRIGRRVDPTVLWIEKDRFLLRRIDKRSGDGDSRWEYSTTYFPEMDVAVPTSLLEFAPPEGLTRSERLERDRLPGRLLDLGSLLLLLATVVTNRKAIMAGLREMRDRQIGLR